MRQALYEAKKQMVWHRVQVALHSFNANNSIADGRIFQPFFQPFFIPFFRKNKIKNESKNGFFEKNSHHACF